MNSAAKTVKGVNIAVIILSALGILLLAFMAIGLVFSASYINSHPNEVKQSVNIESDEDLDSAMSQLNEENPDAAALVQQLQNGDVSAFTSVMTAGGGTILVISFVFALISLIAGIMGVVQASKPEKLGGTMIMSIISAVICLLCLRVVTAVLNIVSAVYSSKAKKLAA